MKNSLLTRPRWFTERVTPTPATEEMRVSFPELFFDLVFVFTIIQLSHTLSHDFTHGSVQVLLIFGVIWWMYAGYGWLTNAVPPTHRTRQILLFTGMAGWLLVALSIPNTFHGGSVWFASGMLLVVLIHGAMYLQSTTRFLPMFASNLTAVGLLFLAPLFPDSLTYLPWIAAIGVMWLSPLLTGQEGFPLHPGHITERHGLIVIITLGESLISIGAGVGSSLTAPHVLGAVLGLLLAILVWWSYFRLDFPHAEHALHRVTDTVRRTQMVLLGFFYAHIPILLGVVGLAAGMYTVVKYPFEPLHGGASFALAGGVGLFFLGSALFRVFLRSQPYRVRLIAVPIALGCAALGQVSAVVQVIALAVVLSAVVMYEEITTEPHSSSAE